METLRKWPIILAAATLLLGIPVGCGGNEHLIHSESSPDAKRVAVITRENWGATEPFVYIVTIYDNNSKRKLEEMPFVGRSAVFAIEERSNLSLQVIWRSNDDLLIRCQHCLESEVQQKLTSYRGIIVGYEFL